VSKLASLAVVLALTSGGPVAFASHARNPSPAAATAAFGHWLSGRYGPITGSWACPRAQLVGAKIDCLAEVRAGRTWHQTSASARLVRGRITFSSVRDVAWIRHWWPFSRRFIVRSRVDVPGVMAVNSPAYDWGFLAQEVVGLRRGRTARANAYDGYAAGWFTFELFTCSAGGELITCTNRLGDAMRFRPG